MNKFLSYNFRVSKSYTSLDRLCIVLERVESLEEASKASVGAGKISETAERAWISSEIMLYLSLVNCHLLIAMLYLRMKALH